MTTARAALRHIESGWLAIAVTARGLRSCSFGHATPAAARTAMLRVGALRGLVVSFDGGDWSEPWFDALAAHFDGQGRPVKLDLSGCSDFARQVYRAARRVGPGRTIAYGELARRIGRPGAARAVGRAMAANPLAPIIPCHRVVAADGALTGYSGPGGLGAKARLLAREAAGS